VRSLRILSKSTATKVTSVCREFIFLSFRFFSDNGYPCIYLKNRQGTCSIILNHIRLLKIYFCLFLCYCFCISPKPTFSLILFCGSFLLHLCMQFMCPHLSCICKVFHFFIFTDISWRLNIIKLINIYCLLSRTFTPSRLKHANHITHSTTSHIHRLCVLFTAKYDGSGSEGTELLTLVSKSSYQNPYFFSH